MAEKNEAEDGSSISLKSPCHMKWDRQQNIPYFTCFLMSQKCKFCFLLYLKEIYAQFVETNVLVKHNIYHELKLTIMDLDLQITWKHPVLSLAGPVVNHYTGDGGIAISLLVHWSPSRHMQTCKRYMTMFKMYVVRLPVCSFICKGRHVHAKRRYFQ